MSEAIDQTVVDLMTEAAASAMARDQLIAILRSGKLAGEASPEDLALHATEAQAELAAALAPEARAAITAGLEAATAAGYRLVKP